MYITRREFMFSAVGFSATLFLGSFIYSDKYADILSLLPFSKNTIMEIAASYIGSGGRSSIDINNYTIEQIRQMQKNDFISGNIVNVNGWLLSYTDCQICLFIHEK